MAEYGEGDTGIYNFIIFVLCLQIVLFYTINFTVATPFDNSTQKYKFLYRPFSCSSQFQLSVKYVGPCACMLVSPKKNL